MRPTVWRLNGKKDPPQRQVKCSHVGQMSNLSNVLVTVVTVPAPWPCHAPAKIEQGGHFAGHTGMSGM